MRPTIEAGSLSQKALSRRLPSPPPAGLHGPPFFLSFFAPARGTVRADPNPANEKALALYARLGFSRRPMPEHLRGEESTGAVYMETGAMSGRPTPAPETTL